ncbi:polysaccharide deacetylase family protein [Dyadobacter sandarakinus]|uniref:Polysaccharide deacetylase family protein n=1 Tax=Dyadobacter sandarakinus TaxID=2747268 RepID=A0ABX7I4Y3_9BACT|nr:polysaccharide deacetylase family protein [Dyadobacter sandarakinus]QRR00930.1 polysaccharide deacetylase family protein [Dyadobacter sandarakinus]
MKHNFTTYTFITVFALSGIIFWETGFAWLVLTLIAVVYFGLVSYGAFNIGSNYFLKSVNKGERRAIALTFDDGPDPVTTPDILATLKRHDVRAAFFVIGKKAAAYPHLVRQIDEDGHIIANHSYSHSYWIGFFSKDRLQSDLAKCRDVVYQTIGKKPVYFRPPFGVTNPRYAAVMEELGLQSVGWSLRSLDTRASNKYQLISRILSRLKKKDIVLLHDTLKVTAESLEDIILHCQQKGIRIESLPRLIRKEAYEQD